jgi:hypothetical protein
MHRTGTRLTDLGALPAGCRQYVQRAVASGVAWVAWSTPHGAVAAWGNLDIEGSRRINACLLLVQWIDTLSGHHSLWAYCDPRRPTEWTIGRGRHNDPR